MMRQRSPGLYVHVPFCASRCGYCDFYSVVRSEAVASWLDALSAESNIYRDEFSGFGTLYIGGGTPSSLGRRDLERLVKIVRASFEFEKDFEFTLEANPDDLARDELELLRDLGVNRLSIGVQSFDDGELRILGRRHDAASALDAIEASRQAGFGNIGIDLIYAVPGQTEGKMRATLERALSFEPEHISCYELTLEPGTTLALAIERGDVDGVGEGAARDLFLMISDTLRGRGYIHYEVSNYAIDEERRSGHNSRYWDHTPYLGLGPSAHSLSSGERRWNIDDVNLYCSYLEGGNAPLAGREILSESQLLLERLYFGFRTMEGFPVDLFDSIPGGFETIAELERTALVRVERSRVVPTTLGYLFSDGLPLLFASD